MEEKKKWIKIKYKYKNLDDVMDFGYVKGKTIKEVIDSSADIGFINWALKTVKQFKMSDKIMEYYENVKHKDDV